MITELSFVVQGTPTPQGSKRTFMVNGRPVIVEQRAKALKEWRSAVTLTARAAASKAGMAMLVGPVAIDITFHLARPKSRPHDVWHAVRPDIDKLTRGVLDALTDAGIYGDDSQVCRKTVEKRYESTSMGTGAVIQIWQLQ